ncbi:MAG TPA: phosphoribosyltransferase family protein [Gemmatimonadales bacterium]|nr:phosphoribosyltransferase family protein [Gemmatimonadales bacterium]
MGSGLEYLTDQERVFRDRRAAGEALAIALQRYGGSDTLVLGLPRGGVVVAAEVARRLGAELDVLVARKLGSPVSAELAIGAVTANGGRFLNDAVIDELGVSEPYIAAVTRVQRAEAQRREVLFRGDRPRPRITGRTVIVVDDGLATGATMRAAVRSARRERPGRLIVAVPVGSREACGALREEADEVVCLHEPAAFGAVGTWYRHFEQTEDSEVQRLLDEFSAPARGPA